MQEIFIVIAFEEIVSQDGNKIVKYDDNTEKFRQLYLTLTQ